MYALIFAPLFVEPIVAVLFKIYCLTSISVNALLFVGIRRQNITFVSLYVFMCMIESVCYLLITVFFRSGAFNDETVFNYIKLGKY